jgi:hypothetical protein
VRIGGPGVVLEDEQIQRFVGDQLAGVPLDGRTSTHLSGACCH